MRRGQAMVETALGSLVLVTIVLFGIGFAEWGVAVQKVKGAVAFETSTAAGQRTHSFSLANVISGSTYGPFNPSRAGTVAKKRYKDFDPLTAGGSGPWSGVAAKASAFEDQCRPDATLDFRLRGPGASHRGGGGAANLAAVYSYLDNRFERRGGVACSAEARLELINIPFSFADTGKGGFFNAPMRKPGTLPLCGIGRPNAGGDCPGELMVLTGDWALDGPLNGADSELNDDVPNAAAAVINRPYKELVETIYEKNGKGQGTTGSRLMERLAGVAGPTGGINDPYLDENKFHMSYEGDRLGRKTVNIPARMLKNPNLYYQTSGANLDSSYLSWNKGSGAVTGIPSCYLGLDGCAP